MMSARSRAGRSPSRRSPFSCRPTPEFGTIVLAFQRAGDAPGGLRLEGWTAIDAQNKKTTVRLSNQRYNVAVPDSAFTFAEPKRKKA